jgi:dihydropteroate synthase
MNFSCLHLDLTNPHIMGILNLTPDSFSDGGELLCADGRIDISKCLRRAEQMCLDGASFLDLGGESTRPGAQVVSVEEEIDRVLPVVEAVRKNLDVCISVDTSSSKLMQAAIEAGAGLINDVRALQNDNALQVLAQSNVAVCLMHMQGEPGTMQEQPTYEDVFEEVIGFLRARVDACRQAGISEERIIIDPGFGFGKDLSHNLELLNRLSEFKQLELPFLVGFSRKSMLGAVTGRSEKDRKAAGIAAAVIALTQGASIIRTHDVAETLDAMKLFQALRAHILKSS